MALVFVDNVKWAILSRARTIGTASTLIKLINGYIGGYIQGTSSRTLRKSEENEEDHNLML